MPNTPNGSAWPAMKPRTSRSSALASKLAGRKWEMVMDELARRKRPSSRLRYDQAWKWPTFIGLGSKKIMDTTTDDLRTVLADDKPSTNHFLRRLHNPAIGLGSLPWPLTPPRMWPQILCKRKRGITAEEHVKIIASETNVERRHFYELTWEVGAAQSDAACQTTADGSVRNGRGNQSGIAG